MLAPPCARYLDMPGSLDVPRNAIAMTPYMHDLFGALNFYREPAAGAENACVATSPYPLYVSDIPPPTQLVSFAHCPPDVPWPAPDLVALHRTAAEYIERVLHDHNAGEVRADSSTPLGALVVVRLNTKRGLVARDGPGPGPVRVSTSLKPDRTKTPTRTRTGLNPDRIK